ncbi:protein scabrous [Megachile rotundata]|uniref:protein scabrous n=1 Tax=Megachile rotundata TaxID=143995 RepID=UPI000258E0B2|nr:PREDICTED: protein scabrous-like [Megachile rotundata]
MRREAWSWWFIVVLSVVQKETRGEDVAFDAFDAIRSLREQVNALLDHRQQDYDKLESSLKRAIEKNTELFVLKDEVKQLRKEVIALRGGGNGNEAKNERLRVRWLGNAVTELQGEVAEVLRARNASEELAERSRLRGELALVRGDVGAVGRGIRNLGGRIAKIEAVLGTIRVDIAAVKERIGLLSRSCADIASQLSTVQIEVKSLRCESSDRNSGIRRDKEEKKGGRELTEEEATNRVDRRADYEIQSGFAKRHRTRVVDRLKSLERKVSSAARRRIALEKRVAYETERWSTLNDRVDGLEKVQVELSRQVSNASENATSTKMLGESLGSRLIEWLRSLEEAVEAKDSSTKREIARLDANAARKAAELSLTREELGNLRRTVQALSVSASKLQERSDEQREAIDRLNRSSVSEVSVSFDEAERLDDKYHLIGDDLPANCDQGKSEDGPRLLRTTGKQRSKPMLAFCRKGWIVVARRIDGSLDFDRSWNDYSVGFGSPVSEYWIGNEMLHRLTRDNCSSLRVDLLDIYGERWRAEYERFAVESKETGYKLRIYGYRGNASDALSYQNGMPFSAKDLDMDASATHCARNYHGGWWFSRCQHANLNGKYSLGLTWFRSDSDRWMSVASVEMSIRRDPDCRAR